MADFHSLPPGNFPAPGTAISGDLYYDDVNHQLFVCAEGYLFPVSGILSGGLTLGVGPPGPAGEPGAAAASRVASVMCVIDGVGLTPSTGSWGSFPIPFDCTVTGWVLTADQPGSAVLDVLRGSYAAFPTVETIAGTELPALDSSQKAENLSLSTWGTALSAGDILQVNLNSVVNCTRLTLAIKISIP